MTDTSKRVRPSLGARAVVVGGGMGGLFAARVLSDRFDEVVVVERDAEPTTTDPRGSVPQGNHFHVLLPGGMNAMEQWFPGFAQDLAAAGSVPMMGGRDFTAYTNQGKSYSLQVHQPEPRPFGWMYVQTRPVLEMAVRRRVSSLPNVRFVYRTIVEGPLVDGGRVVGVHIAGADPLTGDLVVDASGRNSCSARWLPEMGFQPVSETYVNCDVNYASVIVQPREWDAFDGVVFFVMPTGVGERSTRMGTVVKLDGGRWLVGLGSRYGDALPTDWDGFREFGRTLQHPLWSEVVETTEPIGRIATYRLPRAVRRHYEDIESYPEGLLPIGDSVCFFNPTHGQGMSSAAGQCRGLEGVLAQRADEGRGLTGIAADFFPVAADWVRGPWIMAAAFDFTHPMCTGDFPVEALPDLQRLGGLMASAATDPSAAQLALAVGTLDLPLSAVRQFQPA